MRWSEEELMAYLERKGEKTARQEPKKSKYSSKRIWVDGICFDSQKEAAYYQDLKLLFQAGQILGFCRQPEFVLQDGNQEHRAITYRADFIIFLKDGTVDIVDIKGFESGQWKRTEKMFKLKYPGLKLKIIKQG